MRRLLASVLFAGLFSSAAFAEDAPPAPTPAPVVAKKVPLRVVRVLPETQQALLFDKAKGTHVLVETGKTIDGWKVDDIDEDTVTLSPIDGGAQVVLAGPDPSWRRHATSPAAKKPAAEPQDPYASALAPVDPYADDIVAAPIAAGDGGVRTTEAPNATPGAVRTAEAPGSQGPVRSVKAPSTDAGAAPTSAAPSAAAPTSAAPSATAPTSAAPAAPTTATAPTTAPKIAADVGADTSSAAAWSSDLAPEAPTVIAKADVNAALKNFGALAGSMRGSFTPTGARLDAVAPDSLLAKAGLRAGDVITSINNQPLRSLDDAANLYARAGSMRTATIQIERAGKPMSLRLAIQ